MYRYCRTIVLDVCLLVCVCMSVCVCVRVCVYVRSCSWMPSLFPDVLQKSLFSGGSICGGLIACLLHADLTCMRISFSLFRARTAVKLKKSKIFPREKSSVKREKKRLFGKFHRSRIGDISIYTSSLFVSPSLSLTHIWSRTSTSTPFVHDGLCFTKNLADF